MRVLMGMEGFSDAIDEARITDLCVSCMRTLGLPESTELSVSFVDNDIIAELNEEYRGKEGPTDVLSFECDNIDDDFPGEQDELDYTLGDIIIAPDVARAQAQELHETLSDEIELLVVHGVLHLCGYDHIEDDEAALMEQKQQELLALWRAHSEGGE